MTLPRHMIFGASLLLSTPLAAQDATGDAAAGETQFNRQCTACHIVENGDGEVLAGRNAQTGPNLYGVVSAQPGSQHDFRYSDSLVAYGEIGATWDEENMVLFMQDPTGYLREALGDPRARSKMAYQLRSEQDARDVYAFLAQFAAEGGEGEEEAAMGGATTAAEANDITEDAAASEAIEGIAAGDGLQDVEAGETIYKQVCANCHGPKAKGMASFPKLTGRDVAYLVTRLEQYKAGETVGPNSALMIPVAMDLSDEDIANVVAYITTTFE